MGVVLLTLYQLNCVTHTAVLVIQNGQTALDRAREGKNLTGDDKVDKLSEYVRLIHYLESVGK